MTPTSEKGCSKVTMLQTLYYLCILSVHVNAFSLTNCTIKGALDDTTQLKVLCYKMGFFTVPTSIPKNARYLVISFNSISNIRAEEFDDLPNLRHLNLSDNKISWIQEGTMKHFPNLTFLDLANNKFKKVSKGLLPGLTNLEILRLDGNRIEDIEHYAFKTLLNLKVLNLTNNKLKLITRIKPVFLSPSLEELYIASNNFHVFHSYDLSRTPLPLKTLDISHNPLNKLQITDNIFQTLDHLDMSSCGSNRSILWNITDKEFLNSVSTLNLSGLPPESIVSLLKNVSWASLYKIKLCNLSRVNIQDLLQYACLPSVNVIRLKKNYISVLTDHMFEPCPFLTELDLSDNEISNIFASIFKGLSQLNVLRLQLNKITNVNNYFQNLSTLEFIDLSRNKINVLTCSDFANLTRLNCLYLYSNRISKIPSCVFKDLENLEILYLGSNKLLTIANVFENGLHSLKELQLAFNKLSSLLNGSFHSLSNLTSLNIDDNQISKIAEYAFAGLVNLNYLSLSSNRLKAKTIRAPTVFAGMPKLLRLDLFSNFISYTEDTLHTPPFIHLKSLRILSMNSQRRGIGKIPSNLLQGLTSLEMFYGGNMDLNYLHPDTFNSTPKLWFLELSKNTFLDEESITAEVFHPIPKLNKLIISRAKVSSLDFLVSANLSRLAVLQASGNMLDVINQTWIQSLPRLKYLDLTKNTFTCECSNAYFIDWALSSNNTQVLYLSRYTCSYPPSLRGTSLLDLNTESCTVDINFICFVCSSAMIIFTILVSFIHQFFHWQLLYAYYLFLAYLYDSKNKQKHQQQGFGYDAFISYHAQDESWVVKELLPNLEGEQGWRLCLHHRDFEPGRSIIDNIMDGIYNSRKTICLITNNYLRSTWCSKEIQMANFRLFDEQKDVLILVFLEDIPTHQLSPYYQMRRLVKKKTYLKWPKPGQDTKIFWQKLRLALGTKEGPEDEEPILSGQAELDCRRGLLM
ncbi:toll-like receptor 22 [Trichomycterus rosablanca]|uniref:toll-like receptor 22 n=1 Tax=Trichomycterus rosablanca TaxID=2290929 RepID=UPI002F35630F